MIYYSIIALPFFLFFSRLLLSNFIIPQFKKKSFYHQMQKRSDWARIEKIETILRKLFKSDRAKMSSWTYRNLHFIRNKEFTYGEIDFLSFYHILETVNPQPKEIFYDLGSGTGKAVFTAALFFNLSQCVGIELLPPLYTKANKTLKKATKLQQNIECDVEKNLLKQIHSINFINDNFLDYKTLDADIIYVAATCLNTETWEKLITKMTSLKPGSRVIVATKTIHHKKFQRLHQSIELMSWGLCPVNLYKIMPD